MGLYKVHPPYSQHHPGPGFVPGLVRCQGPTVAPGCPRTPAHSCLQCLLFFPDPNRSFKDKHAGLDRTCHPCTSPLGRASFWSLPTEPATMHPVRKRTKGKKACPAFGAGRGGGGGKGGSPGSFSCFVFGFGDMYSCNDTIL